MDSWVTLAGQGKVAGMASAVVAAEGRWPSETRAGGGRLSLPRSLPMGRLGEVWPSIEAGLQASSPSAVNTAKGEVPTVGLVAWIPLEHAGREWARVPEVVRRACAQILRVGGRPRRMPGAGRRGQANRARGNQRCTSAWNAQAFPHLLRGGGVSHLMGGLYTLENIMHSRYGPFPGKSPSCLYFAYRFRGFLAIEGNGLLPSG